MQPRIEIQDLTKTYSSRRVLDSISLSVPPGHITAFLGPNGSGKTTTLRALLGLARPTSGIALICGSRYVDLPNPTRTVGVLLDNAGLHPGRTARHHLVIAALAAHLPPARVDEVLELVGLDRDADRTIKQFSLGMKQRLGLATALLGDPDILILDEPTSGLDPAGARWLRTTLREFAASGKSVLITSHVLAEVEQIADDLVLIGRGRIVASGPLAELVHEESLEDFYLNVMGDDSVPVTSGLKG
ncbi:ABC transporter ATP-binding protein [Spelaeicoccus albus]|uniref:ABC-2 type transport system ATP-binding protein n=1 Tax=Spelaeicoccus albus TaxID=1280376 RepID=A0A7Z0D130_9MICO|nr:ATP-binding cassette domain-containing protein [Spelaeicoccus albus]NYI66248.1 ABC-2 type transport system ATP-binding protein [Spelaeicoccus albus]